ncbi:uncharacterized protein LOC116173453 [Photinus pyralis]|uniref:uncharacterized protein LOC116173453 n=1 Tax=Photinus pyralis TaxID=7054 RepID=UPI0012673DE8|nr:uncharacterized protein LOC116173453 [Photinus pyralis]
MQVIEKALRSVRPNVNSHEIKLKLQGLRTNFFNEHKKVQASKCSGAGDDAVYHPTLWYYSKLLFLLDHNIIRKATDTIEDISGSSSPQEYYDEENNIDDTLTETVTDEGDQGAHINTPKLSQPRAEPPSTSSNNTPLKRKKKSHTDSADKIFEQATGSLNVISNAFTSMQNQVVVSKGNEEIFGEFVVSKLKCITNQILKTNVEVEIINVLYNALQNDN